MNKEQLIQQLKYTKEKHKNDKLFTFDTDISAMCNDILDVLSRCVEIPDNVTNGDVIEKVFNTTLTQFCELVRMDNVDNGLCCSLDWCNSPYK